MGIVLGDPNYVEPTNICNIPVKLLPLPPQLQSVLVQLDYMCPNLPQLNQMNYMVVLYLPGTSSVLYWTCCANLIRDIPRPPLPH